MRAIRHRRGTSHQISKKIRGGKRQLRRLAAGSTHPTPLDVEALLHRQFYYEKLGLHPWHWHHRQPPKQVRQLAAQQLLATFFAWRPVLTALTEPVYAAVWLVGPEFAHSSQVVAGVGPKAEYYATVFGEPDSDGPPLPAAYRELPGAGQLTWQAHPWQVGHDADDYPAGWPDRLLRLPHHIRQYPDNRTFLLVQTGWVWVGQLTDTTPR